MHGGQIRLSEEAGLVLADQFPPPFVPIHVPLAPLRDHALSNGAGHRTTVLAGTGGWHWPRDLPPCADVCLQLGRPRGDHVLLGPPMPHHGGDGGRFLLPLRALLRGSVCSLRGLEHLAGPATGGCRYQRPVHPHPLANLLIGCRGGSLGANAGRGDRAKDILGIGDRGPALPTRRGHPNDGCPGHGEVQASAFHCELHDLPVPGGRPLLSHAIHRPEQCGLLSPGGARQRDHGLEGRPHCVPSGLRTALALASEGLTRYLRRSA
mmetsp:Transcript_38109/g.109984  ORF Transcript_38109/g.109984 Transcript_38109/m.109984 type:complete len:265 (+) Transcript_38109:731-1525(+)